MAHVQIPPSLLPWKSACGKTIANIGMLLGDMSTLVKCWLGFCDRKNVVSFMGRDH